MNKQRIISLIDQLNIYLNELKEHIPKKFQEYSKNIEKKRFCERTLQLMIEVCIDISQLLVKELKLGLPAEEENLFDKLEEAKVLSEEMKLKLKEMKKFRNVLIHRYTKVDDSLVYENAVKNIKDFIEFKKEILSFLKEQKPQDN
ncbi:MAG: DUF86 domain-containing protein [Nanoarchaeota archaeon]|nr:DUF86 domain-containing protein [Nanoarchaeota archaeon]